MDFTKRTIVAIGVGQKMMGTQPICGQLWIRENRKMTETGTVPQTLPGLLDALTLRYALESNPNFKTPGLRVIIHTDFLSKLGSVLGTADLGMGPSYFQRVIPG
jgi:hypothetical protein